MKILKVGITGHMNLDAMFISEYKNKILTHLKALKDKNESLLVYSALADGSDRLIVDVAMELNIDYIGVLPMNKDEYRMDFDVESSTRFNYLLDNALTVKEMPLVNNNTMLTISSNEDSRSLQYESAGKYISDNCDVLIALWDGKYNSKRGGTGEIVKYHCAKKRSILYYVNVLRTCAP